MTSQGHRQCYCGRTSKLSGNRASIEGSFLENKNGAKNGTEY